MYKNKKHWPQLPVFLLGCLLLISCDRKLYPNDKNSTQCGNSITWDSKSLVKIADGNYARVKELDNHQLIAVYSRGSNLYIRFSADEGATWINEKILFPGDDNYSMTNAEAIQLDDKSIVVGCNRRVKDSEWGKDHTYAILIKKSADYGQTWTESNLIYTAGNSNAVGCWEPAFLQLPNGELQCYFANEFPYPDTNEQEISLLRSFDKGNTWTRKIETVCFARGARDGMPVPLIFGNKIILAIEENHGGHSLQPVIIETTIEDNWKNGFVEEKDKRRIHAMPDLVPTRYAGAPYIEQLKTGELIISYMDRLGRTMNCELMKIRISEEIDSPFNRESIPFQISITENTLWNSLCVLDNGTVLAVTSTSAFKKGVYLIKGRPDN